MCSPCLVPGHHKQGLSFPQGLNYVFLKTPLFPTPVLQLDWNISKAPQPCSKVKADLGDSHYHCSLGGREEGKTMN